jgi:hypothetical protein
MNRFDKGIPWYTKATACIDVYFPEDEIKCRYCPFVKFLDGTNQHRCRLNDKILYSIEIIGRDCPLVFNGEVEESEEK